MFGLKALKIEEELDDKINICAALNSLAEILIKSKKIREAEKHLIKSVSIATQIGSLEDIRNANQKLSDCYYEMGDFKQAFLKYKISVLAQDSIFNIEKKQRNY
ncbi:MAG: tetratricopeptide repeat protein [Bacteroidetes bacterium]|nr:tetratricopeptide repeat protein [Bacteroidota bacterium]